MQALEIKDLVFRYDKESKINAIDHVSITVNQGEYVTIIGHNGSGKSTLAKLIVGLLEAEQGKITVLGQELNEENVSDIRGKVGIVFQNPDNQFIGATMRDDIAFGLENHQVPHEKMDEIINTYAEKVNMVDFLDKEPSALSGGQKQRVAIAGVLAMNPDIIIMDESTAMLDPRGKREIITLTHQLKKDERNLTIISITHDLEEVCLSDRCIVLNKGQVIFNDTPEEIFKHEDELLSIGLDLPFAPKLIRILNKKGLNVSDCKTLEELKERLCQ